MRLGVIIPDRGDRPEFLINCFRLINNQTLQPNHIEVVNYIPRSDQVDITQRYRYGYDSFRGKGFDVIALIENDEFYSHDYLEIMVNEWVKRGKPELLGTNYTIYYHLKLKAHFKFLHQSRSSAMSTLIKPDLNFEWCPDHEPFTDLHLWKTLKGQTFNPEKIICLGMKHGIGKCGGKMHVDRLHRYTTLDHDMSYLKSIVDEDSFKFYLTF